MRAHNIAVSLARNLARNTARNTARNMARKTRGNLTADEASELTEILAQLRARFVQIAKLVAAQMQREMAGGGMPGAMPGGAMQGGGPVGSIGLGGPSGGPTTTKSGLIIPD